MARFDYTYGTEFECYLPEGATSTNAARAIEARLGAPCAAEIYNHRLRDHWKLVPDGSLGDYARGIEAVSPKLSGEEGMAAIRSVTGALDDLGCTVSRNCGLHVHVGVSDFATPDFFKALFKIYAHFEPVIDSFMPASRRASANMYCRSITNVSAQAIDAAADRMAIVRLMTRQGGEGRYHKLNLVAFERHGTVEFRQHSGTLDATKACHWTSLCLRMVDAAREGRTITAPSIALGQQNTAKVGSKPWVIGNLMLRPEGVSGAEAMAATGWTAVALPRMARRCGLSFTTQRTGREIRYFARAFVAAADAAIPATLEGMFDFLGCDAAERTYFGERARNLSGTVHWLA